MSVAVDVGVAVGVCVGVGVGGIGSQTGTVQTRTLRSTLTEVVLVALAPTVLNTRTPPGTEGWMRRSSARVALWSGIKSPTAQVTVLLGAQPPKLQVPPFVGCAMWGLIVR